MTANNATNAVYEVNPKLTTDGAGHWVAVWGSQEEYPYYSPFGHDEPEEETDLFVSTFVLDTPPTNAHTITLDTVGPTN